MFISPKFLSQSALVRQLANLRITVTCLTWLFVLVFWGTIDQVEHGLYHAQEMFFHSFIFKGFGFLPLPGGQLTLWVLFFNLFFASISRFVYRWSHLGILIIHFGLLSYFVAAFVTLHCVVETQLTLKEGESSNLSSFYQNWELSIWQLKDNKKKVTAFHTHQFKAGTTISIKPYGFSIEVSQYFSNAQALSKTDGIKESSLNASGIAELTALEVSKEPQKNIPGGVFIVRLKKDERTSVATEGRVILYGGEVKPTRLTINNQEYFFMLRRQRHVLPMTVKLIDFQMEEHPNTDMARSYQSKVEITTDNGLKREVVISMNNPLRYKNYTLYQASYAIDAMGRELSTLAVVKNSGRLLPYISSFLTFGGLLIHFVMMMFKGRQKRT